MNIEKQTIKKYILRISIIVTSMVLFLGFLSWFGDIENLEIVSTEGRTFDKGVVTKIIKDNIQENGSRIGEQKLILRMSSGPLKGQEVEATSSDGNLFGAACKVGTKVVAIVSIAGEESLVSVYTKDREVAIYGLVFLFLLGLCIIGGKNGIKSAIGLMFTFICIIYLFLPMLFRGFSPFFSAIIITAITTLVTMYLIGGWTAKTASAILGTIIGVLVAGITAAVFGYVTDIDGYNVSDIESLMFVGQSSNVQVGGLLFSGILIASLGAVMDVAMSISSTIYEIYQHNPSLSRKELFLSGIHVGRDMMGTMSNTLILAFTGGSLSVFILDYAYQLPYRQIINSYSIGIEIMQGISGSFGVILTVPIVAMMASFLIPKSNKSKQESS